MLHFQFCSTCYTALQTKNSMRSTSAINSITTENMDNSTTSYGLSVNRKENKGKAHHDVCIVCTEVRHKVPVATFNSENIMALASTIIVLCLSEGISQSINQ